MASSTTATVTYVDDSGFVYQGNWQVVNTSMAYVGNGVHGTSTNGSAAGYQFQGVQVQVYCLVYLPDSNSQLPYVYFQLDGVSTPSPWIPHPSDNGTVVVCFQSPNLSTGEHTLAIELANDGPFYLDGLGVQLPAGLQTQTGGGPTLAATSPPTVQTVYVNHLSGSKAPVGPIVGGVVGGVALIAGALLALWFICMRRKNGRPYYYNAAAAHDMLAQEEKAAASVTPYPPSVPTQSVYSDSAAPVTVPPSVYGGSNIVPYAPSSVGGSSADRDRDVETVSLYSAAPSRAPTLSVVNSLSASSMAGLTLGQRKAMEAGLRTIPESSGVQHADSGVRFNHSGEASGSAIPADAPPVYTAE